MYIPPTWHVIVGGTALTVIITLILQACACCGSSCASNLLAQVPSPMKPRHISHGLDNYLINRSIEQFKRSLEAMEQRRVSIVAACSDQGIYYQQWLHSYTDGLEARITVLQDHLRQVGGVVIVRPIPPPPPLTNAGSTPVQRSTQRWTIHYLLQRVWLSVLLLDIKLGFSSLAQRAADLASAHDGCRTANHWKSIALELETVCIKLQLWTPLQGAMRTFQSSPGITGYAEVTATPSGEVIFRLTTGSAASTAVNRQLAPRRLFHSAPWSACPSADWWTDAIIVAMFTVQCLWCVVVSGAALCLLAMWLIVCAVLITISHTIMPGAGALVVSSLTKFHGAAIIGGALLLGPSISAWVPADALGNLALFNLILNGCQILYSFQRDSAALFYLHPFHLWLAGIWAQVLLVDLWMNMLRDLFCWFCAHVKQFVAHVKTYTRQHWPRARAVVPARVRDTSTGTGP